MLCNITTKFAQQHLQRQLNNQICTKIAATATNQFSRTQRSTWSIFSTGCDSSLMVRR